MYSNNILHQIHQNKILRNSQSVQYCLYSKNLPHQIMPSEYQNDEESQTAQRFFFYIQKTPCGNSRHLLDLPLRIPLEKDRKSTRLNSSHVASSYAVFCLKKKKKKIKQ